MDVNTILKLLSGDSKDILALRKDIQVFSEFLEMVEKIDTLPQIKSRLHEENRNFYSLYKVVGEEISPQQIEKFLLGFFGPPVKRSGEAPSLKLKFFQSIKLMGKVLPEQIFFVRKLKKGEFYAAIWPWKRKQNVITLHMGYYSKNLSEEDFNKLEDVVRAVSHERIAREMESGIGGQIRGINLPTFLQMSEQEKSTCVLSVTCKDKTGRIYLEGGDLVDAETGALKAVEAVYEILKWDNVIIEIEKYSLKRKNVIKSPLLNLLLEGLKLKDEAESQNPTEQKAEIAAVSKETGRRSAESPRLSENRDSPEIQVGNPNDRNRKAHKKSGFKGMIIIMLIGLLIGGGYFGSRWAMEYLAGKPDYEIMEANLEKEPDLDRREQILNNFIVSRSGGFYRESARKRLSEIHDQKDDAFYRDILKKVEDLPITHDYDIRAKVFYDEYLKTFPNGKNAEAIRQQVTNLPALVEESQYKYLITTNWESKENKIEAYKQFLFYHPKSKHREQVELFLVIEIEERYEQIQKQLKISENDRDYTKCLELCDRFITLFDNTYRTDEIKKTKAGIEAKQYLHELSERAEKLEPDHKAIKKLYSDYLAQNPNFNKRDQVEAEIVRRERLIKEADYWKALVVRTRDPNMSFIEKIKELDQYIDQEPTGPFADKARDLRDQIRMERLEYDRKKRIESEKGRQEAVLRSEYLQKQQQNSRMNQEVMSIKRKLDKNIYRTNDDGTFTDNRTGLTWMVLDSSVALGRCLTYQEALEYVDDLNSGGRSRWRLPNFSELAGIYKHEPYFPSQYGKWFWTSEKIVKGYHEMVGVVTSQNENVFSRQYLPTNECGAVHAVHP